MATKTCGECPWKRHEPGYEDWYCTCQEGVSVFVREDASECISRRAFRILRDEVRHYREAYSEAMQEILALATPTTSEHEWAADWLYRHRKKKCNCGYCHFEEAVK
jgi:hypothetical protein